MFELEGRSRTIGLNRIAARNGRSGLAARIAAVGDTLHVDLNRYVLAGSSRHNTSWGRGSGGAETYQVKLAAE